MIGIREVLSSVPPTKRLDFCERLAFDLTIVGRAIWSDDDLTDAVKLNALKESNELLHRLWGIIWSLRRHESGAFDRLVEHGAFCTDHAPELGPPLRGMLKITLDHILGSDRS